MLQPGIRRLLGLDVPRKDIIVAELEDELQLHLDLRAEQLQKSGMSPEAATSEALTRYGHIETAKREIHQHGRRQEHTLRRRITFDALQQDVRFALRTLGRSKAWTAVAVATLALGIGANTAVFSVVNDLMLDPLRYPDADRLVLISRVNAKSGLQISPPLTLLRAWASAKSFDGLEGVSTEHSTLATGGEPSTEHVALVSPTFASFAGVRPLVGRLFQSYDTLASALPVVLLSAHLWQSRFAGDISAIGKTVKLNDVQRTIIGVLPDGVRTPSYSSEPTDLWVPRPAKGFLGGPAIGRLKPGVTIAAAQQELQAIAASADNESGAIGRTPFVVSVRAPGSSGQTRSSMYMLSGAVCLLLLIACANVAHLLLARGAARERELSIRAALGAGRGRIVRQLLTESMILAVLGCVGGLAVGAVALRAIVAMRPSNMGELANVHIDARVLAVTAGISVITGVVFGLVAGFGARSGRSFEMLRSSVAGTADRSRTRLRSVLVVTENALSVVLLVGAMLLIRTVVNLHQINPGFDAVNVFAMSVNLPTSRYADAASRQMYADKLLAEARRIPGVVQATVAAYVPTRAGIQLGGWIAEGVAAPTSENGGFTAMNTVQSDYFAVLGMRFVSGHSFNASSLANNEVIISEPFARQLFGKANAIGRRFRTAANVDPSHGPPTWYVVGGVVPDAALLALNDSRNTPAVYFPAKAAPENYLSLIVRMKAGQQPHGMLRKLSLAVDVNMPPPATVSLTELLLATVASERFMMVLLTSFAVLAIVLSAVGMYGVISYMVSQSTREIGVRVALGAARRDVIRLVMRQGVLLSAAGLAVGLLASIWGTRLLANSLYGVKHTDPTSYLVGSAVLITLALCACIAPTVRAIRIDPMVAMRSD